MAETKVTNNELSLPVSSISAYQSTDVSSSGTSWCDLPFCTMTVTLPKGRILVHLSAQQSGSGFTYYGIRSTAQPGTAISSTQIASGGASIVATHSLDGWAVITIPTAGSYTFVAQIKGDNGARVHKAYEYVQFMVLPIGL